MALVLAACHGASDGGSLETQRFTEAVDCDDEGCTRPGGAVLLEEPEPLEGFTFLSLEIVDDLLLYAELPIPGGMAHLEIELDGRREPAVSYVERVDDRQVFEAHRVTGVIEIPEVVLDEDCTCETGRFELRFQGYGPDGLPDTEDDPVRQLSRARFERGDTFCIPAEAFPVGGTLQVVSANRCVRPARSSGGSSGGSSGCPSASMLVIEASAFPAPSIARMTKTARVISRPTRRKREAKRRTGTG